MADCPTDEQLAALVAGQLAGDVRARIVRHGSECADCAATLSALVVTQPDTDHEGPGRVPRSRLGRYILEDRLGAGGMGVVWAARDPELGRRVAIKVLRSGDGERLKSEGAALAKLAHPNVVTVHDVGTDGDETYIAMALVEGETLRHWLATPRSTAEVVRVLCAAGRGVIAIHDAGLVHRDLKPDNIFIGKDGAVQVGDLGLARAETTDAHELAGTPAYMAPEQHAGEATAASDQFSFSVTAWEALSGARPDEKTDHPMSRRLEATLRRALDPDPGRRYPSMRELVDALAPRRRRWPWLFAGALAVGVAAYAVRPTASDPCAHAPAGLEDMWSARRRAIAAKLGASPLALDTLALVDRRATAATALRRDVCRAVHHRHEQKPEALERAARCLDRQAATTASVLVAIEGGLADVPARRMLEALDLPERCRGADAPAVTPAVEALLAEVSALEAHSTSADPTLDGVDLPALRTRARGSARVLARIDVLAGRRALAQAAHDDAERSLRAALEAADSAGDDATRARAAALLASLLASTERDDEAITLLATADAAAARAGGDDELAIDLDHARATVARRDPAEVVTIRDRIVERELRRDGASLRVVSAYFALGNALQSHGDRAGAIAAFSRGAKIAAQIGFAGEADLVTALARSQAQLNAGDLTGSIDAAEQLLAATRLAAPGSPDEALAMLTLADTLDLTADYLRAATAFEAAIALLVALPAADRNESLLLDAVIAAGRNRLRLRETDRAEALFRRALALARADDPRAVFARVGLGRTLVAAGKYEAGRTELERGLPKLAPEALGPRAHGTFALAKALWAIGDSRERAHARALADEAIETLTVSLTGLRRNRLAAGLVRDAERDLAAAVAWRDAR